MKLDHAIQKPESRVTTETSLLTTYLVTTTTRTTTTTTSTISTIRISSEISTESQNLSPTISNREFLYISSWPSSNIFTMIFDEKFETAKVSSYRVLEGRKLDSNLCAATIQGRNFLFGQKRIFEISNCRLRQLNIRVPEHMKSGKHLICSRANYYIDHERGILCYSRD